MNEGVVQYHCDLVQGSAATEIEALSICAWREKLFALDAIGCDMSRYGACYGNVSVRTGPWAAGPGRREFLVSCTQTGGEAHVSPQDLTRVIRYDHNKNYVVAQGPCAPSSESMTHGAIYDASLEVRAVVHGHAPKLWQWLLDQGAPHTPPDIDYGTPEMAYYAKAIVRENLRQPWLYPGVLAMAGHQDGVVAWGGSPKQATERFLAAHQAAHQNT